MYALLPLVAAATVIGFRCPVATVLPAYAATVPFGSLLSTGLAPPYDSISTPLAMLLCAGLLREVIAGRTVHVRLPATVGIWLTFLGVAGASAVWSLSPQLTQAAFRRLALLVLLYLLLALVPITAGQLRRVETALVVGGVAAACYGIAQFLTGTLPVEVEGGSGRFGRELLGANNTAAALIVPLAIAIWRSASSSRSSSRLAYSAASALLMLGILLTGSRGGILAVGATLAVMVATSRRARRSLLKRTGAAVLGLLVVLLLHPGGIASRTDKTSSSGRSDIWRVGIHACHYYCRAGSGWGTFSRVYQQELPKVPDARILTQGVAYEPHNIWLLLAVETGVVGLALALVGFLLTLWQAWELPAVLRAPPLSGLVGTLVASFFLSNFEYKFFWMNLNYSLLCRSVAGSWAEFAVKPAGLLVHHETTGALRSRPCSRKPIEGHPLNSARGTGWLRNHVPMALGLVVLILISLAVGAWTLRQDDELKEKVTSGPRGVDSTTTPHVRGTPMITKALVVVIENHNVRQMTRQMPYLRRLGREYAQAEDYSAVRHPSLPNYLAILGGSTFGVRDDQEPGRRQLTGPSVFGAALSARRTAKAYMDEMPSRCALSNADTYAVRHNPWTYFVAERAACRRLDVPIELGNTWSPSGGHPHGTAPHARTVGAGHVQRRSRLGMRVATI